MDRFWLPQYPPGVAADIDASQGSTAGGMLQTAQRIGIAIGSAVASAVFYTVALGGHPVAGRAHEARFGHAYVAALMFIAGLDAVSLLIAIRSVRHANYAGRTRPARR